MVGDWDGALFWEKDDFHVCACFHLPESQYCELALIDANHATITPFLQLQFDFNLNREPHKKFWLWVVS